MCKRVRVWIIVPMIKRAIQIHASAQSTGRRGVLSALRAAGAQKLSLDPICGAQMMIVVLRAVGGAARARCRVRVVRSGVGRDASTFALLLCGQDLVLRGDRHRHPAQHGRPPIPPPVMISSPVIRWVEMFT